MLRVLIVDDHPLFCRGVSSAFEGHKDIEVIGDAPDGQRAIRMAETLTPDIVLVDVNLPGLNGLEVTRTVRRLLPQIGVIVLAEHEDDEQLFNATKAGAAAYLSKDISVAQMV